jgi:hypothetical protein
MKDFLKSQGFNYITKGLHFKSGKPFFVFRKSKILDESIKAWNKIKTK